MDAPERILILTIKCFSQETGESAAVYDFRMVYFFDDSVKTPFPEVPKYMHMLQHVYRSMSFLLYFYFIKNSGVSGGMRNNNF